MYGQGLASTKAAAFSACVCMHRVLAVAQLCTRQGCRTAGSLEGSPNLPANTAVVCSHAGSQLALPYWMWQLCTLFMHDCLRRVCHHVVTMWSPCRHHAVNMSFHHLHR